MRRAALGCAALALAVAARRARGRRGARRAGTRRCSRWSRAPASPRMATCTRTAASTRAPTTTRRATPCRSRVFEYDGDGTLLRSWTVAGQDLSQPHGVQVGDERRPGPARPARQAPAARAAARPRAPARRRAYAALPRRLDPELRAPGGPTAACTSPTTASRSSGASRRAAATPEEWLSDPRLDGGEFGTTGIDLAADRKTLLVAPAERGRRRGAATRRPGGCSTLPIDADGKPGAMQRAVGERPGRRPGRLRASRSRAAIYIALLVTNQIAVVGPDGTERERFPQQPGSGDNGSSGPVRLALERALPRHAADRRPAVVLHAATPAHQAILDVEAGRGRAARADPAERGPRRTSWRRASAGSGSPARRLRFRLSERVKLFKARAIRRWDGHVRRACTSARRGSGRGASRCRFHVETPGRYKVRITAVDLEGNRTRLEAEGEDRVTHAVSASTRHAARGDRGARGARARRRVARARRWPRTGLRSRFERAGCTRDGRRGGVRRRLRARCTPRSPRVGVLAGLAALRGRARGARGARGRRRGRRDRRRLRELAPLRPARGSRGAGHDLERRGRDGRSGRPRATLVLMAHHDAAPTGFIFDDSAQRKRTTRSPT